MANINLTVDALVCQPPVINSIEYGGSKYVMNFNWNSEGDYYNTFMNTQMILRMEIFDPVNQVYSSNIDTNAPFDTTTYSINILDYYPNFSSVYRVVFTLLLVSDYCNDNDVYVIPENTLPV